MDLLASFGAILGVLLLGSMSPGPSFIIVARAAAVDSRLSALLIALGIGTGGGIFALLVVFGHQFLNTSPSLAYTLLRMLGGAYLLFIAYRIFLLSTQPLDIAGGGAALKLTTSRAFGLGLITQLSNPKAAVFYASVFSALLPSVFSPGSGLFLALLVMLVEAGWYASVALLLSSSVPKNLYLRTKKNIDRVAAVIIALLGLKLLLIIV